MRRRLTIASAAGAAALSLLVLSIGISVVGFARPAAAAAPGRRVDIVKLSGLIDPINADLVARSVSAAAGHHAALLVFQVNSTGGTVPVDALVARIRSSPVPVVAWVGGSGRPRAYGAAYALVRATRYTGEAPGSRVGERAGASVSGDDAVDRGLLDDAVPTLARFLGDVSSISHIGVDLGQRGQGFSKDVTFTFSQLSVVPKLMHTAATPDVAFVMLLIAGALAVFEFFTAGVGVAAGTGILFGVLASYGLGVLPTRPVALVLLALSLLAFSIDVQAGTPRFWTVVGALTYVGGGLTLYHGYAVSLWVLIAIGILLLLFMISGMPAVIRTRFSTPTIGRESMIGELGLAVSGVEPEGTVQVRGAPWRARTNRATPIPAGDIIRVVAIDGLLLEVEPESGGARDAGH